MKLDFLSDINNIYQEYMNYDKIDKYMIKLLWLHLIILSVMVITNSFLKIAAYYPSPFSWSVMSLTAGITTFSIGLLTTVSCTLLRGKIKNHYTWRVIMTFAFTIFSYLIVFISGGSIEMHFHFFAILALMMIYSDWRLGWILLVLVALHHGILNYVAPTWVYFYGRNDFSIVSHALPVILTAIFATKICEINRKNIISVVATIKRFKGNNDSKS